MHRKLAWVWFGLTLGIYAITRLVRLEDFPIYFFSDEAIHPVRGTELAARGWRDHLNTLLPPYFHNGELWNLSLSVYLHAITATLFGKTIFVTRATSAVISIVGAAAIALICKSIFKLQFWWLAPLFVAATPAWFLHSRTAFETALMVSFYALFLLFYLLYRQRSPRFLYPALLFGAATFYAYANGQAVMIVSGILLLFSDLRYHLQNWRIGAGGGVFLVLLALPYARFRYDHPDQLSYHLRVLDSYWLAPLSLGEKLARFLSNYGFGVSPSYWFIPNEHDLIRHRMMNYGHMALWMLPFFVFGLTYALRHFGSSAHRALAIAVLAAPFGSALAAVGITRVLTFIVPANIFTILGFNAFLLARPLARVRRALLMLSTIAITGFNFGMLNDALTNGPVWFDNYGLYGMQWGAKQVFLEAIPSYALENPSGMIYASSVWANGTDIFLRYFPVDEQRVQITSVSWFAEEKRPLDPDAIFVTTREEYTRAFADPKFKSLHIERVVYYPDGRDGFYFMRLAYAEDADAIFAREREELKQLHSARLLINGEFVQITHSRFESGGIHHLFDRDTHTLARGASANPFVLELEFPSARPISTVAATFGSMNFRWTIYAYADESAAPVKYRAEFTGLPNDPTVEMRLVDGPASIRKLRFEIYDLAAGERARIHIRELSWR